MFCAYFLDSCFLFLSYVIISCQVDLYIRIFGSIILTICLFFFFFSFYHYGLLLTLPCLILEVEFGEKFHMTMDDS